MSISLNIKKCIFVTPFGTFFEHIIFKEGLLVDPIKIVVILGLEEPTKQSEVCICFGKNGYYRKFIKGYANIVAPVEEFLKAKRKFNWGDA